jgi:hypothetical protein
MMTRNEWDRLQYEYFQRLIDENRGQKRQVHRAAQVVVAVPVTKRKIEYPNIGHV